MTKQKVLSSNMAATPLSFGSLGIGYKPPLFVRFMTTLYAGKVDLSKGY